MQANVVSWLDGLAGLALEYTVHLPTDRVEHALAAAQFFAASGFPLLNMTLHPLPGWQQVEWPELMALENLTNRVEFHPRLTFDLTHSLLGIPLPDLFHPHVVELHLSGTDGRIDHLPLDCATLQTALPFLREDMLVCFEIFSVEDTLAAIDQVRTLTR